MLENKEKYVHGTCVNWKQIQMQASAKKSVFTVRSSVNVSSYELDIVVYKIDSTDNSLYGHSTHNQNAKYCTLCLEQESQ